MANSTLGMIRRTIVTRDKDTILRLYKSLVRPRLEYFMRVWDPYLKQDMEQLEKVQRSAKKMIRSYKLRRQGEMVWSNNTREKDEQRRIHRSL